MLLHFHSFIGRGNRVPRENQRPAASH